MVETILSLKTVQINSEVTQIMTPTVNVNEHTACTNLLHILHNRLSEACEWFPWEWECWKMLCKNSHWYQI